MYDYFFQLNCRPFDLAPDPKFLFLTGQHARAAANVRFALLNHDSFVVITGEIGTGKTTVLNAALRALGSQYVTARLVHTTLSDVELLQALLSEFGLANYSTKKVKLLDELRAFFLEQHLAGRHVVIIVDEAQHLDPAALEELRLLSCIDSQDRRIVSIVLTGQPALDEVLDDASLAQLRQRTRLRQRLRPMDESVTADYIRHRLKVAGGNADEIFAPETFPEIHRLTLGIPRLINTLCDTALTACMVEKRNRIDLATIESVVQELGWRWAEASGRRKRDPGEVPTDRPQADDRAALLVHLPGKLVARVDIVSVPFAIGRGHGNGLVIEEKEISRRHALIDRAGGHYVIEDLNSRNGLLVNGKRREMANLKSGDVITIGGVKLVFQLKDEVAEDTGEHGEIKASNVIAFGETQRLPDDAVPDDDLGSLKAQD
jgi:type II secretory pathway predicted ATPase ExeA/pSer/pThr/pTyr-binding forkhead associated (FHA) protein